MERVAEEVQSENLDWEKALAHFRRTRRVYQEYLDLPGVNTSIALAVIFRPLAKRFFTGERTRELYNSMMSVE
jgi:hypothetical protein